MRKLLFPSLLPAATNAVFYRLLGSATLISVLIGHAQAEEASSTAAQATTSATTSTTTNGPAIASKTETQTVEVRAKTDDYNPRRDDTASKIIVNHEELVKYGDTSVLDVLKRLPGITVSGASGRGGEIRMRGLGAGYTQILLNGERPPAGFSIDTLSPDSIERIEIIRAATAEFSTQSIAGTINIILKKVIKEAQREIKTGVADGSGYWQTYFNLQMSDHVDQLSYSLPVNAWYSSFDRANPLDQQGTDATGQQILLRHSDNQSRGNYSGANLAPRLIWNLQGGDVLTSQTYLDTNRNSSSNSSRENTLLGSPSAYPNSDSASSGDSNFLRTDITWLHKLPDSASLEMKLGVSTNILNHETHTLAFQTPDVITLDQHQSNSDRENGISTTGKYAATWMEGHALAMGWEGAHTKRSDINDRQDNAPGMVTIVNDVDEASVDRLALYAQDEWNLSKQLSVYLGTRWEGIRTRSSGNTIDTSVSNSSVLSPLLQTLWKLPDSDQIRFAVTRTYKAPTPYNLLARRNVSINNTALQPDYQGNPNLLPELALGVDLSFEHYWEAGSVFSISTSMRRIDNYTLNSLLFNDGRWVMMPTNDGQAHTRDLQLELKTPLTSFFSNAPAIDLHASISRNWSSVDAVPGPHNTLNSQTPLSANLGIDYKHGDLTCGGSFAFRSGGESRQSVTQSSYATARRDLDAYLLWKLDAKKKIRLAVSNILKQDWVSQSTYADANGSETDKSIYPGTMYIRATLETKF